MSDTVDNVMNTVSEAAEPADVVVEETPVDSASEAVEVDEAVEPEPVASASEAAEAEAAEEAEEAPVVHQPEPEPEPEPEPVVEPVSTQEVVQNVQEILSSTETNVTVDSELEERVKVLEERLEKVVRALRLKPLYIN
jgi:hypothetical protein